MKQMSIYKSVLYSCHSKKTLAEILSTKSLIVETKEIRNPDHHFLNKKRTFYQSKLTKEIFDKKPSDYSASKYREFNDSCEKHKQILKRINYLLSQIKLPKYLFSKKKSDYKRNAIYHIGNTKFILLDIDSFFPHCSYHYVKDFFSKKTGLYMVKNIYDGEKNIIRCESDIASSMANLVTVPIENTNESDRMIPQGYPTSPIVSFFAYKEMFDEIEELSKYYGCKFSTYVDDLSFSYNANNFNPEELVEKVQVILNKYGHSLSKKKVKIIDVERKLGNNEELILPLITGLTVKRYAVRASKKMHSKMNKLFNKFIALGEPRNANEYMTKWQCFISLVGIYNTIEYIEPISTKQSREHIGKIIKKNQKNYAFHVNIKRVKIIKYEKKMYDAYQKGTLSAFVKKNRKKLIDYKNKV